MREVRTGAVSGNRPQPCFYESLHDYADRCGESIDDVRGYWSLELNAMYARWREDDLAKIKPAPELHEAAS